MRRQTGFGLIVYLVILAGVLALIFAAFAKTYEAGADHERSKWLAKTDVVRKNEAAKVAKASQKLEVKRESIRTVYQTITRDVDRIVERPVYRNICFDDDGVRVANQALAGKIAPAGKPNAPVP